MTNPRSTLIAVGVTGVLLLAAAVAGGVPISTVVPPVTTVLGVPAAVLAVYAACLLVPDSRAPHEDHVHDQQRAEAASPSEARGWSESPAIPVVRHSLGVSLEVAAAGV